MDGLKEVVETINSRIKNPIWGSIVVAFIVLNFEPLFILLFGYQTTTTRITEFKNIGWENLALLPIIYGLILAYLTPWVRYFGLWIAEVPVRRQKILQDVSMHKILTIKNKLEGDRNEAMEIRRQEILNRARAEDALFDINNPEIKKRAEEELKRAEEFKNELEPIEEGKENIELGEFDSDKTNAQAQLVKTHREAIEEPLTDTPPHDVYIMALGHVSEDILIQATASNGEIDVSRTYDSKTCDSIRINIGNKYYNHNDVPSEVILLNNGNCPGCF